MKKIVLFLIVVFSTLIILGGCKTIDETFKAEPDLTSLTGILKEQSAEDKYLGTHLLIDENNQSTALRSLSINLSSGQYLNNKVQVTGFMNETEGVFEVTGVSIIEIIQKEGEKIEFITYKNAEFGIQLKYYNDWKIEESDNKITFYAPANVEKAEEKDAVEISQSPFAYQPSEGTEPAPLTAFMAENYPEIKNPESLLNKIGPNNLETIKMEEGENVDYFLYRNGLIYKISFIASENFIAANKKVFNEMITEFTFIGFTPEEAEFDFAEEDIGADIEEYPVEEPDIESVMADLPPLDMGLTSFESLPYSFSAKYPVQWYYAGSFGSEPGVLHHYGFSTESVTDENEIISLEVISDSLPAGKQMSINDKTLVVIGDNENYTIYTTVENQNYKISGDKEYANLILAIATSITPVKKEEE